MDKEKFPEIGQLITGLASDLKLPSETYDSADCSFVLPWSKLLSVDGNHENNPTELERVKILMEINRILKTGGMAVLSFPEISFDPDTFAKFTKSLEAHFGFNVLDPSGISYATEVTPHRRIGWIITLQKQGYPNFSGINCSHLTFLSDARTSVSKYKGEKDRGIQTIYVDYPIFSSKKFKVINPLTNQASNADSPTLEEDLYQSPRDRVDQLKTIMDDLKREKWNSLRRRIERELNRGYEDAEDLLAGMIFRRGFQRLAWDEIIERILHSDINRLLRNREEEF